jgi:hypothetical protein
MLYRSKYKETKAPHNYTFSPQTANATLRNHLQNYHAEEYLRLCAEGKWSNQLPKLHANTITDGSNGPRDASNKRPRPTYSRTTFLTHIINFIVADDQVMLNKLNVHHTNRFLHSPSMLSNVPSFAISSFFFARISKTRTSRTTRRFMRRLSRLGRHGSRSLRWNFRYVPLSEMQTDSLTKTWHSNQLAALALRPIYGLITIVSHTFASLCTGSQGMQRRAASH